jgi:hypothetical protein
MSLLSKLTQVAKSEKGKELIGKAQAIANDPKTREKIDEARGTIEGQIDAAKHKLAEKRAEKDGEPGAGATVPATPPPAASTTPQPPPAASTTPEPPPTAPTTTPPTPPPAYGGDDGPKAA